MNQSCVPSEIYMTQETDYSADNSTRMSKFLKVDQVHDATIQKHMTGIFGPDTASRIEVISFWAIISGDEKKTIRASGLNLFRKNSENKLELIHKIKRKNKSNSSSIDAEIQNSRSQIPAMMDYINHMILQQ